MRIPQPLDLEAQQQKCDADGDQDRNTQRQSARQPKRLQHVSLGAHSLPVGFNFFLLRHPNPAA